MEPEVLILQVDKTVRVAQAVEILLCNPLDASSRLEAIGVLGNSTGYLHDGLALQWRSGRMLGQQQLLPGMTLHHTIPTLVKIEFDIPCCRSFDQCMGIVPGMGDLSLFVATKRGSEGMGGTIPAVEVPTQFDQRIKTAHKGVGAVHNRDLLMQGLGWMMDHPMSTIIENTHDSCLSQLAPGFLGLVVC